MPLRDLPFVVNYKTVTDHATNELWDCLWALILASLGIFEQSNFLI